MPVILRLQPHHHRKSFRCGNSDLDDFLHGQDPETTPWRVWVMVPDKESPQVLAYYAAAPEPTDLIFQNERGERWSEEAVWLRFLATDHRHVRQGHGTRMLLHLIRHTVLAAGGRTPSSSVESAEEWEPYSFPEETPAERNIEWLLIQSADEMACEWYLRRNLGLRRNSPGSLFLHITMADMRALFSPEASG